MDAITRAAHDAGAVMIWDLAHSAGAVPVDVTASRAEFAVGCTYKYLNGGPGAPAFIYARPDIVGTIEPALAGWMGHQNLLHGAELPAGHVNRRLRVGAPVVQLSMLDAALDLWDNVDMSALREASIGLSQTFIAGVEARCPQLALVSPRDRGSAARRCPSRSIMVMKPCRRSSTAA